MRGNTSPLLSRLERQLASRKAAGKLRQIQVKFNPSIHVDFSSNDYLGLARSEKLAKRVEATHSAWIKAQPKGVPLLGSTGSRLLTGNSPLYMGTEAFLAHFHGYKHALLANSGWCLNYGLLACIGGKAGNTLIFYDELAHNSLVIGARTAGLNALPFAHNNVAALDAALKRAPQQGEASERLVVVESVYSMDGDTCPLQGLLDVAAQHGAMVLVDEAHGTGVLGPRGEGLVGKLKLQRHPSLLGVVHTFGKAVGAHGAVLVTDHASLVDTLTNYSAPLLYSTSLPAASLSALREAYKEMETSFKAREKLTQLVAEFRGECAKYGLPMLDSLTPIQAILCPGNDRVKRVSSLLLEQHAMSCLPIRAPTVPAGKERLRVVLHAYNTTEEVRILVRGAAEALDQLE